MLQATIKFLMQAKFDNYKVYFHNFSNFDGIFLLRIISNLTDNEGNRVRITPIIKDGRFIEIKVYFDFSKKIIFRDSYLLLPASLDKLAKNFNVEHKTVFPHKFLDLPTGGEEDIDLNYIGNVPTCR